MRASELVQFSADSLPTPAVGTGDDRAHFARTFINSTCLALLAIYQVATFFLILARLARALVGQRSLEVQGVSSSDRRHLFRGTGWMAVGVKLGVVETAVGFASGSFGLFFTRRLLRLLGRACLIIGTVRGCVRSSNGPASVCAETIATVSILLKTS